MVKTSAKIDRKLDGVKKLKVDTWFDAVMENSQQTAIEPLVNFLSLRGLDSGRDKWDRYKKSRLCHFASGYSRRCDTRSSLK